MKQAVWAMVGIPILMAVTSSLALAQYQQPGYRLRGQFTRLRLRRYEHSHIG